MIDQYTLVDSAPCDGGMHIAALGEGEDCCRCARRHGGHCLHGADGVRSLGDGATLEECQAALDRLRAEDAEREAWHLTDEELEHDIELALDAARMDGEI